MSLSRRALFRTLAGGGQKPVPSMIAARGWEALQAEYNYTGVNLSMLEQMASRGSWIRRGATCSTPGRASSI
jgi:hypothetical protein